MGSFWGFIGLSIMTLSLLVGEAVAFDPPIDKAGPLTARIEGPFKISEMGKPISYKLVLENNGDKGIQGRVTFKVIDDWQVKPATTSFSLKAKGTTSVNFTITSGRENYNAHYPIHALVEFNYQGTKYTVHPILIFETSFPEPAHPKISLPWQVGSLPSEGGFALWRFPIRRVVIRVFGEKSKVMPVGWQGSEERTRAYSQFSREVERGGIKDSIVLHPPWFNGLVGTIIAEFPLQLPQKRPIVLRFANAIRDHHPEWNEPPSDGVTFRVRVLPFDAPDGEEGQILYEKHTDSKVWVEGEVDLSPYAGKSIRLQLESHPGPKNDTTCDESYWGEPTLIIGAQPQPKPFPPASDSLYRSLGSIRLHGATYEIRLYPGNRGLLDSTIGFVGEGKQLFFQGFRVRVFGDSLEDWRSPTVFLGVKEESKGGRLIFHHKFENYLGKFDLLGEIWVEGGALRVNFRLEDTPSPRPWLVVYLEDIALGRWSEGASRVYAGDGNVLVEPQAFNLWFDGHSLATSFVGFDFQNGVSIVEGVDAVPSYLEVTPSVHHYTIHASHQQTISLIPCGNAWEGVKVWREINGLSPAGGVEKVAGRFVFDLWGGRYKESALALQRAFNYGLTDSLVVWHNWQRWGYDYRLPDIYPPNPQMGTLEDFKFLVETCRKAGVLFAPHDNYIDFYPDAEGFTYKNIAFWGGVPVRAWYNEGRKAQSYRWRADKVEPFLKRNLHLIKENIGPTAYFIDVWSSIKPYDYWTYDGKFYDCLFTRNTWGRLFAWIRDYLGDNAPQISESGHDQLIGYLDGGQTNHMRADVWGVRFVDAERIPWFDMAHHKKFILHGAGYENRYASGLDTRLHGIYSDDYISTEVMTGHPSMVPQPFGRDVVRKYYLLHDLGRSLALKDMEHVEFVEGDIHRLRIVWEGGGEVWVNRGEEDWRVEGHVLPQYGFYARIPTAEGVVEAGIERKDGIIVDWSRSPSNFFVNARPLVGMAPISVNLESLEYLGDRRFRLKLRWNANEPLKEDMHIFVHFTDRQGEIKFQADHKPPIPTTQWKGTVISTVEAVIPPEVPGGEYELRVGLYNTETGRREQLRGFDDGTRRIRLAKVVVEGKGKEVRNVRWEALPSQEVSVLQRLNPEGKEIDFGGVRTNGACRLTIDGDALLVVPLPDSPDFVLRIRWDALPWRLGRPKAAQALKENGEVIKEVDLREEGGEIILHCEKGVFAYRLH